jgi:hypothetical protein
MVGVSVCIEGGKGSSFILVVSCSKV